MTASQWLAKVEQSLACADRMLDEGYIDSSTSRAYYGSFYVATALFKDRDVEFRRHGRLVAQFATTFSQTGQFERRFHTLLIRTYTSRHDADYTVDRIRGREAIASDIAEGREFLAAARSYLANPG